MWKLFKNKNYGGTIKMKNKKNMGIIPFLGVKLRKL